MFILLPLVAVQMVEVNEGYRYGWFEGQFSLLRLSASKKSIK
jgi:hypothetical protein